MGKFTIVSPTKRNMLQSWPIQGICNTLQHVHVWFTQLYVVIQYTCTLPTPYCTCSVLVHAVYFIAVEAHVTCIELWARDYLFQAKSSRQCRDSL